MCLYSPLLSFLLYLLSSDKCRFHTKQSHFADLFQTIDIRLLVPRIFAGILAYNTGEEKNKTAQNLDIIADDAAFADAFSNVEPHQHLSGYQSVPQGIL